MWLVWWEIGMGLLTNAHGEYNSLVLWVSAADSVSIQSAHRSTAHSFSARSAFKWPIDTLHKHLHQRYPELTAGIHGVRSQPCVLHAQYSLSHEMNVHQHNVLPCEVRQRTSDLHVFGNKRRLHLEESKNDLMPFTVGISLNFWFRFYCTCFLWHNALTKELDLSFH